MNTSPEDMNIDQLIQELEDRANAQPLWNRTAQVYAEAAERLTKLTYPNG